MDCKDLMIGDWVKVEQTTEVVNAKVLGVYKDGVINYEVDYSGVRATNQIHSDYVSPIELTEEILVKNGFSYKHKEETCSTCSYHHWQLVGEYLALDDCQYWRKEKKDDLPRFRIAGIDVNYVHQLQHLLRLCGVEKELTI